MTVLCYHAVDDQWSSPLSVDPHVFEEHCDWLRAARRVVSLESAMSSIRRSGFVGERRVTLTFDDGFASVHEHAAPVLASHSLPATVYLVAGTLARQPVPVTWVDDPPDHPLRVLTLSQVLELREQGISFGSHSYAHHDLTTLSYAACLEDLRRSKELLEELLGVEIWSLAYPRGRNNARVRAAAAEAGYRCSVTLPEGPEPVTLQAIPRVGVYPADTPRSLRVKTTPGYLPLRKSPVFPFLRRLARRPRAVPAG